ncbi:unnamed protein product, partial [Brachionus calyciflorus]
MINIESRRIRNILKKIKLSDIDSIDELTETQKLSSLSIKESQEKREEFTEKNRINNNDFEENIEYMDTFEEKLSIENTNLSNSEEESETEDFDTTESSSLEDQTIDSENRLESLNKKIINLMSFYNSDTNFDDFFYYKVSGFAICKRDIRILLENKWLSSEV